MNQQPSDNRGARVVATGMQRPNPLQLLLHVGKTARLIAAIMRDARVSIFRKLGFTLVMLILVAALLAGDTAAELVSNILPVVGPILNIPADATIDWAVFAFASYNLLGIFPTSIVSEHYDRLFRLK